MDVQSTSILALFPSLHLQNLIKDATTHVFQTQNLGSSIIR